MIRAILVFVVVGFIVVSAGANDEVETLIDQLVDVSEPGFGYSGGFAGSEFLPYKDSQQMGTLVLGGAGHARSETLQKIVEKGAEAVPMLLKHLGDDRKIKMEPMSGMMWQKFPDEYDFNRRTRKTAPKGVNRDSFSSNEKHPDNHAVTVGDLCFVALGQIVNRRFSATRYQPTGGLMINSPTYSRRLREVILQDWKGLTRDAHRRLLVEDFKKPDDEDRRIGAYYRLTFYYPEMVEALVLEELKKPAVNIFKVNDLCRDQLYKTSDVQKRKELYDKFIQEHGAVYAGAVMDQLFDDLDTLEAHEAGRSHPPLTAFGTQPRELLIQLFNKPANVKSADRPARDFATACERARFIRALTHDRSQKVGDVVRQIFLDNLEDDYLSSGCLACLASRGYGDILVERLEKIDPNPAKTNYSDLKHLTEISTSQDKAVRAKLLEIFKKTKNELYFMAALDGIDRKHDPLVLELSNKILDELPDDTRGGEEILEMIDERFPEKAKDIFKKFLKKGSAQRAGTMCNVLWYGHPLSKELLGPMLDDKRKLDGFTIPMRVCDRAAQAISHTTDKIKFDTDWPEEEKDYTIDKLKKYCQQPDKP